MRAILTPDDLKKGDLVPEPGWYPVEFVDYQEEEAGTDKSTNCKLYFKILDGVSKGVTPQKLFNEKALGFGKALWAVFFGPADPVKGYELTTESIKSKLGTKLKVYIKKGKSNKGNEFNDITDFQPM